MENLSFHKAPQIKDKNRDSPAMNFPIKPPLSAKFLDSLLVSFSFHFYPSISLFRTSRSTATKFRRSYRQEKYISSTVRAGNNKEKKIQSSLWAAFVLLFSLNPGNVKLSRRFYLRWLLKNFVYEERAKVAEDEDEEEAELRGKAVGCCIYDTALRQGRREGRLKERARVDLPRHGISRK